MLYFLKQTVLIYFEPHTILLKHYGEGTSPVQKVMFKPPPKILRMWRMDNQRVRKTHPTFSGLFLNEAQSKPFFLGRSSIGLHDGPLLRHILVGNRALEPLSQYRESPQSHNGMSWNELYMGASFLGTAPNWWFSFGCSLNCQARNTLKRDHKSPFWFAFKGTPQGLLPC